MSIFRSTRRAPGMSRIKLIMFWDGVRFLLLVLFRVLYRARFEGAERVPRTGPVLYVANHQSHFDPPMVGVLVHDRPCAFLARASLFQNPLFGALIRFLNAIPLEREKSSGGAGGALRSAIAELEAGRCVLLFPEGTRTRDGLIGHFKPGFMLLVKRTGATVVPIGIEGGHEVWPPSRSKPRLCGSIRLRAGEPIPASELIALETEDAIELLKRRIEAIRLALAEEKPDSRTAGKP